MLESANDESLQRDQHSESNTRDVMVHKINHANERDSILVGFLAFVLTVGICLVSLMMLSFQSPVSATDMTSLCLALGIVGLALGIVGLSLGVGWSATRWTARRATRHKRGQVSRHTDRFRAGREADTLRKLEEARRSGAFDQWETRDK